MHDVVLVFPPLVETSFGTVYPSTAVLAAYLEPIGFAVEQVDLNTPFLDFVLREGGLATDAREEAGHCAPEHVAAATWARRHLSRGSLTVGELVDAARVAGHPLEPVRRLLLEPYCVDPDRSVLRGTVTDPALVETYDRYFRGQLGQLAVDAGRPMVLGISVPMGPQLVPALRLAATVKDAVGAGAVRVVLGGSTVSLLDDPDLGRLLRCHPAVDAVVRFDGEAPLDALAAQVRAGRWEPQLVPGVSATTPSGVTHAPPARGPDLNRLPTPRYSAAMVAAAPTTPLGVIQARGCYWGRCDYCDYVEVYKGSPPYRGRRPELVVDDMRALVAETGLRRFRLITESIPAAFARRFADLLLAEPDLDVEWSSFAMVDRRFDAGLLRSMAASGCGSLVVGLESMVTRALKLVHKAADREENIRFLSDARAAGIRLFVNLIPDLPTTTHEEALAGLRDLEALADCMDDVRVFEFEATQSSRVGRSPRTFGLTPTGLLPSPAQAQLALNSVPVRDEAMTPAQRHEVLAAYRGFAARVRSRRTDVFEDLSGRHYVEVLPRADGPLLVNLVTLDRARFPPAAASAGRCSCLVVPSPTAL